MTRHRVLPCRRRTDRQQEAVDITGTGELHDSTNGDGVNQDDQNEQPWTLSGLLELGQDDQDGQVTLVSCDKVATHADQLRGS
jgi:hypothetical protein